MARADTFDLDRLAKKVAALDDAAVARLLRRTHLRNRHHRPRPATSSRRWYSPEEDRLMGAMPDSHLAKIIGRTKNSVRNRRLHLGRRIKPSPKRCEWRSEEDSLLGRYSDSEVARRLDRSFKSVQSRRFYLGIAGRYPQFSNWTPEQKSWLGNLPEEEIVHRTGRSLASVRRRLRQMRPDLSPAARKAAPKWTKADIGLLGKLPDNELAAKLGRTAFGVAHKRQKLHILAVPAKHGRFEWTPCKDRMLRSHSDRALVALWHCSPLTLRKRRGALGIPPTKRDIPWTAREDELLRRLDKQTVARLTGRTLAAVISRHQLLCRSTFGPG